MSVPLEIRNLCCVKGDRLLFSDLNLTLQAGQLLLVEGPNGSGKTSLLRILTGLNLPESGDVLWNGEPIGSLGADYYEQISYIGHHDGLKRDLTCLENLRLVQAMGKPLPVSLQSALEQVKLKGFGEHFVSMLSAGQKRRLALARLIVVQAKLWVMDEPFTSLDKASMGHFQAMFEQHLEKGGLVVMTSHHDIEMPDYDVVRLDLGDYQAEAGRAREFELDRLWQ